MGENATTFQRFRDFLKGEYVRAFRHDHWNVGIVDAPIDVFLEPVSDLEVRWLPPPPPETFHADPFGLTLNGTTAIFFEKFDFRSNKGSIACVREGDDGVFSRSRVAIELPFHAAYPFLIEHAGSAYCIPDTGTAREIGLYRALEFPNRWTKATTLVRGVGALDSTVFERDGMFWLFCSDLDDWPFSTLKVWYAPELFGPWTAHPRNPVKIDVKSARPAGTPFEVDGEMYRPGQDCSKTYGGSVALNRIVRLTTTEYREECVAIVGPFRAGPYTKGIHTLSAMGERTLVDGKFFAINHAEMARQLRASLKVRCPRFLTRT